MATASTKRPVAKTVASSVQPSAVASPADTPPRAPALIGGPLPSTFLTEPNSPFPDGYSIARERELLAPHIAEGLEDKPIGALYDRYIELLDREDRVQTLKAEYERKMGADHEASREEAIGMRQMGRLVDDTVDQMEVHTLEAYRLFLGRRREPGTNAAPIIGGKKMGAVLRSLWLLTGRDNPYADWSLIRHEHAMKEVHAKLQKAIADAQALLAAQQKWGMTLSILRSEQPKVLNLGFRSPYGYAVMQLVGLYDFFIRLMKTLERKSLRTDEVVRQSIADVNRTIRRVWYETARFDRWLSREEIKDLCRSDFAEGIGEDAAKRAQFALEVFGAVPSDVFGCVLKPTHSRRHLRESPEERKFLAHMRLQLARAEAAEEEGDAGGSGTEGAAGAGGSS
ncbi:MAG: TIGR03761 family integrating conjugative element protein [Pseudomonas aeruginosa]